MLCLCTKFSRCTKFWVCVFVLLVDLCSKFTGCATKLVRSSTAVLEFEWLHVLNLYVDLNLVGVDINLVGTAVFTGRLQSITY